MAAKAATTTIPIVFLVGEDPTRLGLVGSLARPSGNLTGINLFANELEAKRLELLHQLVPDAKRIAVLVNPADVTNTETTLREVGAAARTTGLQVHVLKASTARGIDEAFAAIGSERPDYAARILKGAKPADLPVIQASKFELVINLPTARLLGLTLTPTLLAIADEVIE